LVAVEAVRSLSSPPGPARSAIVLAAVGLGLLGLLDDLAGTGDARGFRGHLTALAKGRLTTGGAKLLGGGALAVMAAAIVHPGGAVWRLLVSAAVIALGANLGNLFDRAPGRTIKAGLLGALVLVLAAGAPARLIDVMVIAGAALALLVDDLREQLMLGDTGANVLGGVLGVGVVLTAGDTGLLLAVALLVVANLASEVVSFSRLIDAVPPLRALDRAGRRRD
jgi:UDP-N-acetylmuramyl pentapeptide phosphotransferase/UDP-N-acetylglucosamine-1-phosphate transferase